MPNYQYLGCGQTVTKTSKQGNQYLQRCIYVAPIKDDGSLASSANVYLMGDKTTIVENAQLVPGDKIFLDFNHRGFLADMRKVPKG